ncbi:hypothetical protein FGB62_1g313 [Gracilaria domingensis]|nr:hypothetical protein FGB62_1g313 [Gracilaria domingensis]
MAEAGLRALLDELLVAGASLSHVPVVLLAVIAVVVVVLLLGVSLAAGGGAAAELCEEDCDVAVWAVLVEIDCGTSVMSESTSWGVTGDVDGAVVSTADGAEICSVGDARWCGAFCACLSGCDGVCR